MDDPSQDFYEAATATESEMRRRFAEHEWAVSPLGARETWPAALQVMVNTMLLSPMPMFVVSKRGLVHLYNDAFISHIGARHPEAFGKPFSDVWGKSWPGATDMVENALTGSVSYKEDAHIRLSCGGDEELVYFTFSFSPIVGADASYEGVLCICEDTTKQVLRRDENQNQVKKLLELTRQAPGFIAMFSGPSHVIEMGNEAYMDLVGHRPVLGKPLAVALPEAAEQGFVTVFDELYGTGLPVMGKAVRYVGRAAGTLAPREFFLDYVFQPIFGSNGEVTGVYLQGYDVTESVQAHRALQGTEQELRQLANTISQLAWIADADGWIHWYNDRWYEYTGTTLEEMQGWGWTRVHAEGALPQMMEVWKNSLSTGTPFEATFPLRGADGKYRTFFTRAAPLIDDKGNITKWFGTNTDVTDIEEAKRSLEEANRRKDEFLAMLAHELRNPLAPVATAAELLKTGKADGERVKKASEIIGRQVKHMTRLIDDLLDVSRVTRGLITLKPRLLTIHEIILAAIEQVQPLLVNKEHRFSLRMADDVIQVRGDKARLVQVVANLLNNAAKYTDAQGKISLHVLKSETTVTISVTDNGIGISAELMPHIFELFSQGERTNARSQGGLGLGLALVKSLVDLSGGAVSASSDGLNRGSVFAVTLPQAFDTVVPELFDAKDTPLRERPDTICILVVDDNEDAVDTLSMFLTSAGHEVTVAYNARETLLAAQKTKFDVIFLDIGLPDLDGYALARRLRLLPMSSSARILAITGYGQASDRERTKEAGFDEHLVKPVSLTQVLEVIEVQ